jgi:hypothetical protein
VAIPAALKRRIKALEYKHDLDGSRALKVFIYHPEEDIPYWDPEPPEAWQQAHPKGCAVILQVRNFRVD